MDIVKSQLAAESCISTTSSTSTAAEFTNPKSTTRRGRPRGSTKSAKSPRSKSPEKKQYEVEAILDKREKGSEIDYYVKWKGYDKRYNRWIPKENCGDCEWIIQQFEDKLKRSAGRKRKASSTSQSPKRPRVSSSPRSHITRAPPLPAYSSSSYTPTRVKNEPSTSGTPTLAVAAQRYPYSSPYPYRQASSSKFSQSLQVAVYQSREEFIYKALVSEQNKAAADVEAVNHNNAIVNPQPPAPAHRDIKRVQFGETVQVEIHQYETFAVVIDEAEYSGDIKAEGGDDDEDEDDDLDYAEDDDLDYAEDEGEEPDPEDYHLDDDLEGEGYQAENGYESYQVAEIEEGSYQEI